MSITSKRSCKAGVIVGSAATQLNKHRKIREIRLYRISRIFALEELKSVKLLVVKLFRYIYQNSRAIAPKATVHREPTRA